MKTWILFTAPPSVIVFLLCSWAALPGGAQETDSAQSDVNKAEAELQGSSPELAAIRAGAESFLNAFNRGDAKAIASLWTEEGEYVDESGERFAGRAAIEKAYAAFFAARSGAKMKIAIDSLQLVGPNTAIEDGQALLEGAPNGGAETSRYTAVHVKADGKWLMASVRDARNEIPDAVRNAADLQWLIGTWVAEEHGVQLESAFRWVVDGRFIERAYTTTQVDGTKSSGLQLIGWNPQGGYVQSWDYGPDGGHAVGVWYPTEGGWQANVQGTTGDGIPTAALNRLTRLDDNAYVWQSMRRFLGGVALPDTDEVVIKRRPTP